jgi:glycosidase
MIKGESMEMKEQAATADKAWWRSTVFYEIYMPSFNDGNGDGIGDFPGIVSKLDYLKDLGVRGLWLTPFFPSPRVDNGYDIADYYDVDPIYGTLDDFDTFISEAHRRGIKVIVDLVLNHTSSMHPWFQESRSSRTNPKRNWYIWKDAHKGGMPNNWESFFGGPAWEWDKGTGQYYYHAFAKEQVDLNWANPEVRQAMKLVMAFWMDRGIDGFRLDVINFLKVSGQFRDNPIDHSGEQKHQQDQDQPGILEAIREICDFAHSREGTFMVGEVGSEEMDVLIPYSAKGLLDVVFNFNLGSQKTLEVESIYRELKLMNEMHGPDQLPTLFFSSHDMPRHISRFQAENEETSLLRGKLMATLTLTAKGVPFLYYGEEIGMKDVAAAEIQHMRDVQGLTAYKMARETGISEEQALELANSKSRDKSRTPMQWDQKAFGGFSSTEPWIRLGPSYEEINVQTLQGKDGSLLEYYRQLIRLRSQYPALHAGHYKQLELIGKVIIYTLHCQDQQALILLNYGDTAAQVNIEEQLEGAGKLLLSSRPEVLHSPVHRKNLLPYEAAIWMNQ